MNFPSEIKRKCEASLLFYTRYIFKEYTGQKFEVADHHIQIAETLEKVYNGEIKRLIINIPPRYGKAIDCKTDILTNRGFIKASEVRLGDKFIGSDGKYTNVVGIYPQGKTDLYRVTFSDNSYVDTCSEHLWTVKNRDRKNFDTLKTKDLINDLYSNDGRKKWMLPIFSGVKETIVENELTIDPYVLGIWLGDGSSYKAEITTMDDFIKNYFDLCYERGVRTYQNSGKAETIGYKDNFIVDLKNLDLIGNKHIPKRYLFSDYETRLHLLKGLMDSDGTCNKKNGAISFSQKNRVLVDDFKILISSLGAVYTEYNKNGSIQITFRLPNGIAPFNLERKKVLVPKFNKRLIPRRFIKSIEKLEDAETICFEVDADDKLFCVTKDLILTHNTELAVKMYMSWALAKNPRAKFIHLSYSDRLVEDNSSQTKEYIQSDAFQALWRLDVKKDTHSKKKWYTEQGGGVYAVSSGGAITGFGAGSGGAIIIDDPLKPDDANSDVKREFINNRYNSTIRSRTNDRNVPIIVIMQRLHEEDMSGFLLDGGSGEDWHHLKLAALNEDNEPLWEDKHTFEELEAMRNADRYTFAGQYMQEPAPLEGGEWRRDWFNIINKAELPPNIQWGMYIDGAYTKDTKNDPTGIQISGRSGNDLYILKSIDKYLEMPELKTFINDFTKASGVQITEILIEPKASGKSLAQLLRRETNFNVIELSSDFVKYSKIERARSSSPFIEGGRVYLVRDNWNDHFLHQVSTFPNAKHDEHIDITSYSIERNLMNPFFVV